MASHRDPRRLATTLGVGLLFGPAVGVSAQQLHSNLPATAASSRGLQVRPVENVRFVPASLRATPRRAFTSVVPGTLDLALRRTQDPLSPERMETVDRELLENIRKIEVPEERVLALVRAAIYKIASKDYEVARRALDEAAKAAPLVPDDLRRDLRLIAVMDGLIRLGSEQINEAMVDTAYSTSLDESEVLEPQERVDQVDSAYTAFEAAGRIGQSLTRPAYRYEAMHSVVVQIAGQSQSIDEAAIIDVSRRPDIEPVAPQLRERADRFLVLGNELAWTIRSGPWRDQALGALVGGASDSNQFERGLEIAQSIPFPESRAGALLRLAESQVRRGSREEAIKCFGLVATALASIPIDDLRATLTDVLVDSLTSAGYFTDARRAIVLYPTDRQKVDALAAIANSMGERGRSEEAQEWIMREVAPQYHSFLLREVNDGVLRSLKGFRPESFSGGPRR